MSIKNIDAIHHREGYITDIPCNYKYSGHSEIEIEIKNGLIYFRNIKTDFSVVINDLKELFNESGL